MGKDTIDVVSIDDDPLFNNIFKMYIDHVSEVIDSKITLKIFNSVNMAIDDIIKIQPNIIFLDLNMPIKNGWDFLDEISEISEISSKIYVLTSSIYKYDQRNAENHHRVNGFVSKPIDIDHLISIFNNV